MAGKCRARARRRRRDLLVALALLALAPGLGARGVAQDGGQQVDCSCESLSEAKTFTWSGQCLVDAFAAATPSNSGKCSKPGCVADNCRWQWSMYATSTCGEPQFFINGLLSDPADGTTGWSFDRATGAFSAYGEFRLGCGESGALAIGFGDVPSLELSFGCFDCPVK